jgi:hypothetical protein
MSKEFRSEVLDGPLKALPSIDAAAAVLLRQGMSEKDVAELMLCEAYHLHAKMQGALKLAEGWPERANASFQRAVAAFCVEMCNATITEAGDVLLPYGPARDE